MSPTKSWFHHLVNWLLYPAFLGAYVYALARGEGAFTAIRGGALGLFFLSYFCIVYVDEVSGRAEDDPGRVWPDLCELFGLILILTVLERGGGEY